MSILTLSLHRKLTVVANVTPPLQNSVWTPRGRRPLRPQTTESFRTSIQAFIRFVESHPPTDYSIIFILRDFGFQRRRMYDVMSVLCAIGCCQRNTGDTLTWTGLSSVPATFHKLQKEAHADSADPTLNEIVGCQTDVSISGLTAAFILCFLALRRPKLDIKHVSQYLARQSGRQKSILCKLYQIAHILEAAGVLERSAVPREVGIAKRFFAPIEFGEESPYSLDALLVHAESVKERVVKKRVEEFVAELDQQEREGFQMGRSD
jgi:hypothetical protein